MNSWTLSEAIGSLGYRCNSSSGSVLIRQRPDWTATFNLYIFNLRMLNKPIISLQPFQQKQSRSADCFFGTVQKPLNTLFQLIIWFNMKIQLEFAALDWQFKLKLQFLIELKFPLN